MVLYLYIEKRCFTLLSTEREKAVQQEKSKMGKNSNQKRAEWGSLKKLVQNGDSEYYRDFLL
jgi:hypothetical protein